MNASPYLALSWPLTYSSVCSMAMFIKPSKHASTPARGLRSAQGPVSARAGRAAQPGQGSLARTSVVHPRVQLHNDRPAQHVLQEGRGIGRVWILIHGVQTQPGRGQRTSVRAGPALDACAPGAGMSENRTAKIRQSGQAGLPAVQAHARSLPRPWRWGRRASGERWT
jgi:hypothetical protein